MLGPAQSTVGSEQDLAAAELTAHPLFGELGIFKDTQGSSLLVEITDERDGPGSIAGVNFRFSEKTRGIRHQPRSRFRWREILTLE